MERMRAGKREKERNRPMVVLGVSKVYCPACTGGGGIGAEA